MSRLFIGNFDFEHRLARPAKQAPALLRRINAELATSWLAVAEEGDFIWTPEPIEPAFFEKSSQFGLPRVRPVTGFDEVPPDAECIPWGWTYEIRSLCDRKGWAQNAPPDHVVRTVNSRRFSAELEREWRVGLDFSGEANSIEPIERFVDHHGADVRWVIKAEFGMSGRERLTGRGRPTEADSNWISKRLHKNGAVFFEPWIDSLGEVGIQIEVPRQGEPRFLGMTPMLVDHRGQYRGSGLPASGVDLSLLIPRNDSWGYAVDIALRAARRIQDLGYFGPLGIDAMQYRDLQGRQRIRPLQDINARWTMGRLSLGFRRMLNDNRKACWLHGPAKSLETVHDRTLGEYLIWSIGNLSLDDYEALLHSEAGFDWLATQLFADRTGLKDSIPLRSTHQLHEPVTTVEALKRLTDFLKHIGLMTTNGDLSFPRTRGADLIETSPHMVGDQVASHRSLLWVW